VNRSGVWSLHQSGVLNTDVKGSEERYLCIWHPQEEVLLVLAAVYAGVCTIYDSDLRRMGFWLRHDLSSPHETKQDTRHEMIHFDTKMCSNQDD
jgi:hypothetical protein